MSDQQQPPSSDPPKLTPEQEAEAAAAAAQAVADATATRKKVHALQADLKTALDNNDRGAAERIKTQLRALQPRDPNAEPPPPLPPSAPKMAPHFYGYTAGGDPVFGDRCHQQRPGAVPVCAITDLDNRILMSNTNRAGDWVVLKARTNINNYWDASTAFFQCAVAATDLSKDIPPSPGDLFRHQLQRDSFTSIRISDVDELRDTLSSRYGADQIQKVRAALESEGTQQYSTTGQQSSTFQGVSVTAIESALRTGLPGIEDMKVQGQSALDHILSDINRINVTSGASTGGGVVSKEDWDRALQDPESNLNKFFSAVNSTEEADDTSATLQSDPQLSNQEALDAMFAPPLNILDEICIYFGYLDTMRPVTQADLAANRLLRRGVWVVDTVTKSGGSSAGIVWTVQCRDRLKYLMDTLGSFNTAAQQDIFLADFQSQGPGRQREESANNSPAPTTEGGGGGGEGESATDGLPISQFKRAKTILYIAKMGIGDMDYFSVGGRRINEGFILDIADYIDSIRGGQEPDDPPSSDNGENSGGGGDQQ